MSAWVSSRNQIITNGKRTKYSAEKMKRKEPKGKEERDHGKKDDNKYTPEITVPSAYAVTEPIYFRFFLLVLCLTPSLIHSLTHSVSSSYLVTWATVRRQVVRATQPMRMACRLSLVIIVWNRIGWYVVSRCRVHHSWLAMKWNARADCCMSSDNVLTLNGAHTTIDEKKVSQIHEVETDALPHKASAMAAT